MFILQINVYTKNKCLYKKCVYYKNTINYKEQNLTQCFNMQECLYWLCVNI